LVCQNVVAELALSNNVIRRQENKVTSKKEERGKWTVEKMTQHQLGQIKGYSTKLVLGYSLNYPF